MIDLSAWFGLLLMGCGTALQEFAASRKHAQSVQRNCNDSRATLLLYLSLGISLELMSLGLLSFFCYSILRSSHIAYTTIFFYKAELKDLHRLEQLGSLCIHLSCAFGFVFSPYLNTEVDSAFVFITLGALLVITCVFFWFFKTHDSKVWLELATGAAGTIVVTSNKLVADLVMASLDHEQSVEVVLFVLALSCTSAVAVYLLFNYASTHSDGLELRLKYYTITVVSGLSISLFAFGEIADISLGAILAAAGVVAAAAVLVMSASRLREREVKFNELGSLTPSG